MWNHRDLTSVWTSQDEVVGISANLWFCVGFRSGFSQRTNHSPCCCAGSTQGYRFWEAQGGGPETPFALRQRGTIRFVKGGALRTAVCAERYSQISEPESDESVFYSCQPYTELPTSEPVNVSTTSLPVAQEVLAPRSGGYMPTVSGRSVSK